MSLFRKYELVIICPIFGMEKDSSPEMVWEAATEIQEKGFTEEKAYVNKFRVRETHAMQKDHGSCHYFR